MSRLQHFPVAFFAMIMGLGGLAIAWRRAEDVLDLGLRVSVWLLALATGLFLLFAAAYAAKLLKFPAAARDEWQHPVKMNFVPGITTVRLNEWMNRCKS